LDLLGGKLNGSTKLLRHQVSATSKDYAQGQEYFGQTALEPFKLLTANPPAGV